MQAYNIVCAWAKWPIAVNWQIKRVPCEEVGCLPILIMVLITEGTSMAQARLRICSNTPDTYAVPVYAGIYSMVNIQTKEDQAVARCLSHMFFQLYTKRKREKTFYFFKSQSTAWFRPLFCTCRGTR